MLRYLYADELHKFPKLAEGMFRDRADQFKTRLGWDVHVNEKGEERERALHAKRAPRERLDRVLCALGAHQPSA